MDYAHAEGHGVELMARDRSEIIADFVRAGEVGDRPLNLAAQERETERLFLEVMLDIRESLERIETMVTSTNLV